MSDIRTALQFPTQPWEAAKTRFLQGLSEDEIKLFKEAGPENLFYGASALVKDHVSGSRTWRLQERLASFADALDDYGKALDVVVNTSPLILSPLWGSLRVLIHVSYSSSCQLFNVLTCGHRLSARLENSRKSWLTCSLR